MKTQTKEEALESVTHGNKNDYLKIFAFAELWIKSRIKPFSCDDLKEEYYNQGGIPPLEPRVFGAIFRDLSKASLILPHGYTVSKNKLAHKRPLRTWVSMESRLKQ